MFKGEGLYDGCAKTCEPMEDCEPLVNQVAQLQAQVCRLEEVLARVCGRLRSLDGRDK